MYNEKQGFRQENILKISIWKLLQFIILTKSHLFKWKISTDSLRL